MPIVTLPNNPTMQGLCKIERIIYSHAGGEALEGWVFRPWDDWARPSPAIVFVQGSGWTFPDVHYQLPQLAWYARSGYVVMTVTHRNREKGHPFPAYLQDVKCAIRYLRANADHFRADPDRIAVYGTSSGGNTALLVAMTGDDPRYKTEEYQQYSDSVCCMAECFGPTWMEKIDRHASGKAPTTFQLAGDRERLQVMREMSPCCIVDEHKQYPPMMLLQGDKDDLVDWQQTEMFYKKMQQIGQEPLVIHVEGAPHEGTFWSDAVHRHVLAFFNRHMM
ncbi:MAG: alpha/beta hydrolase [Clostridiales bacterium]|nr:alpha/beta hydrolase [Clostridiales bacterium]